MAVLEGLGVGVHGWETQGGSYSLHQPGYAQQTDLSSMPTNICLSILIKLGRLRLHSPRVEAGPKVEHYFQPSLGGCLVKGSLLTNNPGQGWR